MMIGHIQAIAKKHKVNSFYLFGSYADGSQHDSSDIDLAFLSSNESDTNQDHLYFDLQEGFEQKLDLIDLRKAPLSFGYSIIKDGKVIYDVDEDLRTDFEDYLIRDYLDFRVFDRSSMHELATRFQLEGNKS